MSNEQIVALVDEGLGNSSYLVDLGDGRGLAVDASRDLRALHVAAAQRALRVVFAADTHLHADFLSGAVQLAATDGARVLASASGGREFAHTGLSDGDELDLGGLTLRALATPGHTFEHLSLLLLDEGRPLAVFTGGSLLVGAAARTDLAGDEHTVELACAQYRSLRRLAALPDDLVVLPTHGAGSFCSTPPGAARTTTIGREKTTNPLLAVADEDGFVATLLGSLGSYPPYFRELAEANRRGPSVVDGRPRLTALGLAGFDDCLRRGGEVIDVRPIEDFAAGHVPGALSIELRPAFATWLGWLTDAAAPLVFVRNPDQDADEIVWQALKIGREHVRGELVGGMHAWSKAGRPVTTHPLIEAGDVSAGTVIDIRQHSEYAGGHLPAGLHVELGDLIKIANQLPAGVLFTMCGHGERAATAASVLERAGRRGVGILLGGPDEWAEHTGVSLQAGG